MKIKTFAEEKLELIILLSTLAVVIIMAVGVMIVVF
jgi:hypothetical protein